MGIVASGAVRWQLVGTFFKFFHAPPEPRYASPRRDLLFLYDPDAGQQRQVENIVLLAMQQ